MEKKRSCGVAVGTTGFVCQYQLEDGSSQFIFLHIDSNRGAKGTNTFLNFSTQNYVQLISSCQGLLLLLSSTRKHELYYHVFNPMSKHSVTLPQPAIAKHNIISSGLAFDGNQFQVVLLHVADGGLEMEIFSSQTGIWVRHRPLPISLSLAIPVTKSKFRQLKTPPLFSNGAIHWEISGHLLMYCVQDNQCELIELPNFSEDGSWESTTHKQCFWESGGRVHYSYTDIDGVHTWVLLNEHDHDCYSCYNIYDRKKFRWALAQSITCQNLALKHQDLGKYDASPLGFAEESETMYLQLPGFVVSYNTRTQDLEEVCTYKIPGKNFNCCSFFPIVHGSDVLVPSEAGVVNLPIKDKLDTLSFLRHKEYGEDKINRKIARALEDVLDEELRKDLEMMGEGDKGMVTNHGKPHRFIKLQMKRLCSRLQSACKSLVGPNSSAYNRLE